MTVCKSIAGLDGLGGSILGLDARFGSRVDGALARTF
jgi:hypothetical protein